MANYNDYKIGDEIALTLEDIQRLNLKDNIVKAGMQAAAQNGIDVSSGDMNTIMAQLQQGNEAAMSGILEAVFTEIQNVE